MQLMLVSVSLFILLLSEVWTKEVIFPDGEKVLSHVAQKLTPGQCWIVGNYLAQKAQKPSRAQTKMTKVGGRSKDFDCLAALKLWASVLLPPKLLKVERKELYAKKQLQQALVFVGRKDLRNWLRQLQVESSEESVPEQSKLPSEDQVLSNDLNTESTSETGSDEKASNWEAETESGPNSWEPVRSAQRKTGGNGVKSGKLKRGVTKKPQQEQDSTGKQVIKYVVLSVIGIVSLCLTVAIACSCRGRGRDPDPEDQELGIEGSSTESVIRRGTGDAGKVFKDYETPGRSVVTVETGDNLNANLYNSVKKA